ncbi:acetyltransferase [Maribacter aestuarii]|uniref:acetyltransferase n=1 Tax=Maribacter aestuarii TaxID=1130723 RepID=UPI0025A65BD2|nr:acetyltransferase [Maribacter aestuarii]
MHNIIIIGASGHGNVVLDCIEKEGKYRVVGFVDSIKKKGLSHNGYPVLGTEYDLPYIISAYNVQGGIIAIGDNWSRKLVEDRISAILPDFNYIKAIHPNAIIGKRCTIGEGAVVLAGAVVNSGSVVGKFCILNTNSSLDHDSIIGDYSSLAPRVTTGGNLILGCFSAICLGASIIENVEIGEHTVVGAGALVLSHIPSMVMAFGTPATVIKKRKVGEGYLGRNSHSSYIPSYLAK